MVAETTVRKKHHKYKLITTFVIIVLPAILLLTCNSNFVIHVVGGEWQSYHLLKIKISDSEVIEDIDNDADAQSLVREIRAHDLRFVSNIGPGYIWVIATDSQWEFLRQQGYVIKHILQADELTLHKRMVWGPALKLP